MTGSVLAHSENLGGPVRFVRKNYFPQCSFVNEAVEAFLALFHRYSYICKPLGGGSWFSANEQWQLTDTEILKAIAGVHPKYYLGCRSGKATRFAVIDIDKGSQYHNQRGLKKIIKALNEAGIMEMTLYRSSDSNGWHLYIYFDEWIFSKELRSQLVRLFSINGLEISKGTLEIFPSNGDGGTIGNGLRLPLQQGWAWLDINTLEVTHDRNDLSAVEALDLFMTDMHGAHTYLDFKALKLYVDQLEARQQEVVVRTKSTVVPIRQIKQRTASGWQADAVKGIFLFLPPGIIPERWLAGREFYEQGLQGPSQRAEAVLALSHYLFYGDPSRLLGSLGYGFEQEREWAVKEILETKHNGFSQEINKNTSDALAQIERATHWVPPHRKGKEIKPYNPVKVPISWARNSANLRSDARLRISKAVEQFVEQEQPFSIRDLIKLAKCSANTLYRHQDLWKEVQARLWGFATDLPEYNAVKGASCSETKPPLSNVSEIMPPGRLAAKQIVAEIVMRNKRKQEQAHKQLNLFEHNFENNWRQQVNDLRPPSVKDADTKYLQMITTVFKSLLMRSPNDEQETWLREILAEIDAEIQIRIENQYRGMTTINVKTGHFTLEKLKE